MINPYVPEYNPALDIENGRIQAGLVQQLGMQVRNDLTTIQTNRQLGHLAEGLQSIDPNSRDFPQRAVGLMMQYPLAAKSPIGTAAISQLGAQHKLWQQEQLRKETLDNQFGLFAVRDAQANRPYGSPAMTVPEMKDIASGKAPSILATGGVNVPTQLPTGGPNLTVPGADLPPATAMVPGLPGQPPMQVPVPVAQAPAIESLGSKLSSYREELKKMGVSQKAGDALLNKYAAEISEAPKAVGQMTDATGNVLTRYNDGSFKPATLPSGAPITSHIPGVPSPQAVANLEADNRRADMLAQKAILSSDVKLLDQLHRELATMKMGTGPEKNKEGEGFVAWDKDKDGNWKSHPITEDAMNKWLKLNDTISKLSKRIQESTTQQESAPVQNGSQKVLTFDPAADAWQ